MQRIDEHDFLERAGFYSAEAIHGQLKKREPYTAITPVIFVGIVDFNLFDFSHYLSHHFFTESKTGQRTLNHSEFHFVELKKFTKELDDTLSDADKWIYLLNNADELRSIPTSLQSSHEITEAMQVLNEATWSDAERLEYLAELDVERGRISTEEWMQKQVAEKVQELVAEKAQEQVSKKTLAIAKRLLETKMSHIDIADITGLSIEEIEKLKKETR